MCEQSKLPFMPKLTVLVATFEKQTKNCVGRILPQIDFSRTSVITMMNEVCDNLINSCLFL